jgi:hypothetical protein
MSNPETPSKPLTPAESPAGEGLGASPVRIFLQWNGDAEPGDTEPCLQEVTWCKDRIFLHDVEYVRADRVNVLLQALHGLTQPCTRADYTVPQLDKVVQEIAAQAIIDFANSVEPENATEEAAK